MAHLDQNTGASWGQSRLLDITVPRAFLGLLYLPVCVLPMISNVGCWPPLIVVKRASTVGRIACTDRQCRRVRYPSVTTWDCTYSMCQTCSTALHKAHVRFAWFVRPDPCRCHAVPCRAVPSNEGASLSKEHGRSVSRGREHGWTGSLGGGHGPACSSCGCRAHPNLQSDGNQIPPQIPPQEVVCRLLQGVLLCCKLTSHLSLASGCQLQVPSHQHCEGFIQQSLHLGRNVRPP